jgi:hypothetical protein
MLTGLDLVKLMRDTEIQDLEGHLASCYEMRAEDLSATAGAVAGAALASGASLTLALVGSDPASLDAAALLKWTVSVLLTTGLYLVVWRDIKSQLGQLRPDSTAAKDLVNILRQIYR